MTRAASERGDIEKRRHGLLEVRKVVDQECFQSWLGGECRLRKGLEHHRFQAQLAVQSAQLFVLFV